MRDTPKGYEGMMLNLAKSPTFYEFEIKVRSGVHLSC